MRVGVQRTRSREVFGGGQVECMGAVYDDHPFIVLTETKFSFRCIPVWIGTLLAGLGSKKRTHVIMFSP